MIAKSKFFTVTIHILVWLGLFLIPFIDDWQHFNTDFILRVGFTFSLLAGIFYFNYYFLIPRLFLKQRIFYFLLAVLGTILLAVSVNMIYAHLLGPYVQMGRHHPNSTRLFFNTFFPAL